MKTILLCAALIFIAFTIQAQAVVNINSDAQIVCTGAPQIVLQNTSWRNAGTFESAESSLNFNGSKAGTAKIGDNTFNNYYNIVIDRGVNEELLLQSDIDVSGNLSFNSGHLYLNGQSLTLLSETSRLHDETSAQYAFSYVGGEMIAGTLLSYPDKENPGNLGAIITAYGDLSYTEVRRGYGLFQLPTSHSIARWYQINTTAGANAPSILRFSYFDHELNALDEAQLQVWHSTDNGFNWLPLMIVNRNTTDNWVEAYNEGLNGMYTLAIASNNVTPDGEGFSTGLSPETRARESIFAYPNPMTGPINVNIQSANSKNTILVLTDVQGKTLFSKTIVLEQGINKLDFDFSFLSPGTYFLKMDGKDAVAIPIVKMP